MKEEQTIAKITKDSFKKRELRFTRIENLEKSKEDLLRSLEIKRKCIEPHARFRDICHSIPIKELYFHPIVLSMLKNNTLKIFQLSQDGLKWEPWNYIPEEYNDRLERGELFFYEPVKKHIVLFVETYNNHVIKPIMKKIQVIDRRIEASRREISAIQSKELHKISIEEAFLYKKYVTIFREMNMSIYSLSQSIEFVVKNKRFVCSQHLNECIHMMRQFNEDRMVAWVSKGMDEKYDKSVTLTNTYRLLPRVFSLIMRLEKQVKTRLRRNTIYVRPVFISSFVKEINLFKKKYNKIWIQFYTSSIPYILEQMNFSDVLIQHIYEYVYGEDKPIEYSYKRPTRSPQSRTLIA
jgi:hypothetical protein